MAKFVNIHPSKLSNPESVVQLFVAAVADGYVSPSTADLLAVFAAARHACKYGKLNPAGMFAKMVRGREWHLLNDNDEAEGRSLMRAAMLSARVDRDSTTGDTIDALARHLGRDP